MSVYTHVHVCVLSALVFGYMCACVCCFVLYTLCLYSHACHSMWWSEDNSGNSSLLPPSGRSQTPNSGHQAGPANAITCCAISLTPSGNFLNYQHHCDCCHLVNSPPPLSADLIIRKMPKPTKLKIGLRRKKIEQVFVENLHSRL